MIRRLTALIAGLAAGLVAACDQAPQSTELVMRPGGTWTLFQGATARGPLPLTVIGAPVAQMDAARAFEQVARGIERGITKRQVTVVNAPSVPTAEALHSVWVVDTSRATDPNDVCAAGTGVPANGSDPDVLWVMAVFCNGTTVESAILGQIPRPKDAGDPLYGRLIGQMARQLSGQ